MEIQSIPIIINGQQVVIPMNWLQYAGLTMFIEAYNRRAMNLDFSVSFENDVNELMESGQLRNFPPIYLARTPLTDDMGAMEGWSEASTEAGEQRGHTHDFSMAVLGQNRTPFVVQRDLNLEMIQGFITGAQLMGVNWERLCHGNNSKWPTSRFSVMVIIITNYIKSNIGFNMR